MFKSTGVRWALIGTAIAILVLAPFMVWDEEITSWTESFLDESAGHSTLIAVVLGALLAADIVAPIPNSLIATAAGLFLGFVRGTLTSTIGMTISCIIGYYIGKYAGRPTIGKFVGAGEMARLEKLTNRFGYWAIAMTRSLPVLGEAAVIFAGMSRMPTRRFIVVSVLSTLGLSAVYGAAGAFSAKLDSFVIAFLVSIGISALGMLIVSQIEKRTQKAAELEVQPG